MSRTFATAALIAAFAAPAFAQDAATTAPTTPPAATTTTTPAPAAPAPSAPATTATAPAATPAPAAPAATPAPGAPGSVPLPPGMTAQQAHDGARNQLGVLKYCQEKGWGSAESVAGQEKMIGMLPAADAKMGDAAEEKGKAGQIEAMGQSMALADGAKAQNTTEEALCKQMDALIKQMSATMPAAN